MDRKKNFRKSNSRKKGRSCRKLAELPPMEKIGLKAKGRSIDVEEKIPEVTIYLEDIYESLEYQKIKESLNMTFEE